MSEPIRVVVADDQELVRTGIRMVFEVEDDIELVGEAHDGYEVVQLVRDLQPDVTLMDIRMPNVDGLEATRRIMHDGSETRVVILTTFDLDEYVYQALQAGASGFVLKDIPPEQLVASVRAVAGGETMLSPSVTKRLIESFVRTPPPGPPPPEIAELTPRETGDAQARRPRAVERRDRRRSVRQQTNREDAHRPHPHEARPARPAADRRLRVRTPPDLTGTVGISRHPYG